MTDAVTAEAIRNLSDNAMKTAELLREITGALGRLDDGLRDLARRVASLEVDGEDEA